MVERGRELHRFQDRSYLGAHPRVRVHDADWTARDLLERRDSLQAHERLERATVRRTAAKRLPLRIGSLSLVPRFRGSTRRAYVAVLGSGNGARASARKGRAVATIDGDDA